MTDGQPRNRRVLGPDVGVKVVGVYPVVGADVVAGAAFGVVALPADDEVGRGAGSAGHLVFEATPGYGTGARDHGVGRYLVDQGGIVVDVG